MFLSRVQQRLNAVENRWFTVFSNGPVNPVMRSLSVHLDAINAMSCRPKCYCHWIVSTRIIEYPRCPPHARRPRSDDQCQTEGGVKSSCLSLMTQRPGLPRCAAPLPSSVSYFRSFCHFKKQTVASPQLHRVVKICRVMKRFRVQFPQFITTFSPSHRHLFDCGGEKTPCSGSTAALSSSALLSFTDTIFKRRIWKTKGFFHF